MKHIITKSAVLFLVGFFIMTGDIMAQSSPEVDKKITLHLDGLSCPFCAYGLEKNLKKLEGMSELDIKINEGIASFRVTNAEQITDEQLQKVVKEAGFTLRSINRENIFYGSRHFREK